MTSGILMFHKPRGYEVTRPRSLEAEAYPGQRTVYALLPAEFHAQGWVPVGRLDKDSTGLLLFVQQGRLVDRLGSPGKIDKVYEVWVRGHVRPEHVAEILAGVKTPSGVLRAKGIEVQGGAGPKTRVRVVLDEGRNRHIRKMFAGLTDVKFKKRLKVVDLKRVAIGPLTLDIESGRWRFLTDQESDVLLSAAGMTQGLVSTQNK
jgi:23S rRNA pseudouridine2605 synthase